MIIKIQIIRVARILYDLKYQLWLLDDVDKTLDLAIVKYLSNVHTSFYKFFALTSFS